MVVWNKSDCSLLAVICDASRRVLLLGLCFFLNNLSLYAEKFIPPAPAYVHKVWQSEDGLPNNSVRAVTQSRDGYLWVATDNGLARFDGARFTDIERKTGDKRGRWLFGLIQSRDESIWSSSINGGVTRFHGGKLTRYTTNDGLPSDLVLTIKEDSHGNVWFGTGAGLCRFSNGKFVSYTNHPGLIVEAVRAIVEDQKHNLWIGTAKGLCCLREDNSVATFTMKDLLVNDAVMCLHEDRRGALWIGTAGGLTIFRDEHAQHFTTKEGLAHNTVRSILEDSEGNLWIGTQGGLQQFVGNGFRLVSINNVVDPDLEGITYVYSICEDREGNIWVGNSVGLNRLRKQTFVTYTREQGLPSNETTSVFEDEEGTLWIGTYGGGLCWIKGNDIQVLTKKDGLADNHVLSICRDNSGSIWIGYEGFGIDRWRNGTISHFKFGTEPANVVRVIYEDSHNSIWLGSNQGVARFLGSKFERKTGWSQNTIKAIVRDPRMNLWFTGEANLFRITRGQGVRTYSRADGFGQTSGNCLFPDGDICWVGTDEGLCLVQNDRVYNFSQSPSLGRNAILHIVGDDMDRLWMSGRNGIFVARKDHLTAFARGRASDVPLLQLGKLDGLRRAQANGNGQPGGWKTRDGRILFPTLHGLIVFDPKTVDTTERPLSVRIEGVTVDGQENPPSAEMIFPPGKGHVEFRYTAFHFQAPEKITFKYMIEGFDSDWVDAGTRRTASYHLASGSYRFKVMVCNRNGVWNQNAATVAFVLKPHFYETIWFYGVLFAGGAAVIGLLFWMRQINTRKREAELMRLVEIHTAKYRNAAQSMESFNYSIAHDLRAPLRAIKGLTQALVEDFPQSLTDATRDYTQRIVSAVERMDALITDLLNYGQLTHKDFKFTQIQIDLVISQALVAQESEIATRRGKVTVEKPLGIVWGNETLLLQIFSNLISNALKFVPRDREPTVRIWAERVGQKTRIFVRDNGIGIEPRFHQKIYGVFERLHSADQYPGTGIGLAIVKKAVEQMEGQIGLESKPGEGCCFWIELWNTGDPHIQTSDTRRFRKTPAPDSVSQSEPPVSR